MARKFLYVIAALVVLVLAALLAMRIWSEELTEFTFVPSVPFEQKPPMPANAWDDPAMWIARPGLENRPDQWLPGGIERGEAADVAVFFVHPTSYIEKGMWNADPDEPASRARADLFVRAMASPFNASEDIWAPRYRQAAFGAFLTDKPEAEQALSVAYGDVRAAFAVFLRENPEGPIVLAGHSQGAFLLRRLLRDEVAGKPLAGRIVAAYIVGWPVSLTHDLPRMGLPACARADQPGCVLSWLTVADPADTTMLMKGYQRRKGLDGQPVGESAFLCTNPLTGTASDAAIPASENRGTLVPDFENASGTMVTAAVPAQCQADHFLHIGSPPDLDLGPYVLPGNNYHVYDISMFWSNIRADFARRLDAWQAANPAP
jgi:hypothetical protein